MKKNIFLLLILLSTTVCSAKDYSTQQELKKIEDEVQKCIDTNFTSDYTMAQCVINGINTILKSIKQLMQQRIIFQKHNMSNF